MVVVVVVIISTVKLYATQQYSSLCVDTFIGDQGEVFAFYLFIQTKQTKSICMGFAILSSFSK